MRVLLLTQFFTPEVVAARLRLHPFAAALVRRGHEVEVVCEVPNHPEGVVRPGFRGRPVHRRRLDGFDVRHVWVSTSPRKTTARRLLLYGSYAGMASLVGACARRPHVVVASSPPLPVGAAAAVVAARHRVPWVFDVRDPWPEVAVELGELAPGPWLRAAEALERGLYRSARAIVAATGASADSISARSGRDVTVIGNGTTDEWLAAAATEVDRGSLGLPADGFLRTYAGNLGLAQGLESAIDAAALLGDGFRLLLLGAGPARQTLERRAAERAPGRVIFRDAVEPDVARRHLRASDALLVSLATGAVLRRLVPSKLFDGCAVGRPVVLCAGGESERLVTESEAALVAPPGDPAALAAAVTRLRADPDLRARLSAAGHAFAARHRREDAAEDFASLLERVAGRGGGGRP